MKMRKNKSEQLYKYDYYKTQFFALSITVGLGYIYASLYNHGIFGEKFISLSQLLSSFITVELSNFWFYISLLPVIIVVLIPQIRNGEFRRIQFYNPSFFRKMTGYIVLSVLGIILIILLSATYLFSIFVFLGMIMISYSILFYVGQKIFTIQGKIEEIQRMRIEDS